MNCGRIRNNHRNGSVNTSPKSSGPTLEILRICVGPVAPAAHGARGRAGRRGGGGFGKANHRDSNSHPYSKKKAMLEYKTNKK